MTKKVNDKPETHSGIFIICPFHGKIEVGEKITVTRPITLINKDQTKSTTDMPFSGYKCPVDGCTVDRLENEVEN